MHALTADQISLVPKIDLSRRLFAVTSLAAGFASAVTPVSAATITTDAAGLDTGEAKVRVPDGEIPAYYARPRGTGPFPTILVVQEIFGIHEYIKDVCRGFGKEGYLAVAPAPYAREGDVATMSDINQILSQVVAKVPDAQVMQDLDATAAWAKAEGRGDTSQLGITGFCWGGRFVWLYAEHSPELKAGVAWYGRLAGDTDPLRPKNPIDLVDQLKAPVLGLYGGKDQGIPVASIERMREAVRQAGKTAELQVYPEADHGFHADYRPSYDEAAAKDGWVRCLAWFRQHGVG
ncbi:MAG: dienelactone hydrolase family protein [Geminicoccaceae bacterium]